MNDDSKLMNFEVSSFLKSVIGKDLINNDFVAIFELVKNSFDAHATNVDIHFEGVDQEAPTILIIDNGKGMSYADLTEKWLKVAHSAKQDGTEDKDQSKVYAGYKGIGRFSCDRLGASLKLQSKSKEDSFIHVLEVDWGDFEKSSKDRFENINVNYVTQPQFFVPQNIEAPKGSGVILEISLLRDPSSWDRKKLLKLKQHLAKLVNPFGGCGIAT